MYRTCLHLQQIPWATWPPISAVFVANLHGLKPRCVCVCVCVCVCARACACACACSYCDNPENRRRCRVGKPWGHPGSAATEASTEGAPEASTGSSSGEDGSSEGEGSAGPAFYDPASPDCPVHTGLPLPSGWGHAYDNRRNLFYFYDHADAGTVTHAHPTGGDAG